MTTSIIYFVYYGYEKTVIDSQVITPVELLRKQNINIKIVFMESWLSWLIFPFHSQLKKRYETLSGDYLILPRIPRNIFYLNSFILGMALFPRLLAGKPLLIHARGFQGTHVATLLKRFVKNVRVICDARGLEADEFEYTLKISNPVMPLWQRWWCQKLKKIQKASLELSDSHFAVSRSMISFFEKSDPRTIHSWEYIPCAVKTESYSLPQNRIDQLKKSWGLENRIIIVYSGAAGLWHMPRTLIDIFKRIRDIEESAFLLVLTPDVAEFSKLAMDMGIDERDLSIRKVRYEEIPDLLSMGDIGLLFREDNVLNRYSCPTKFAEYLSAGLHVLASDTITDISEIIQKEKVGTIIRNMNDQDNVLYSLKQALVDIRNTEERRKRSQKAAKEIFDWNLYIPTIKRHYLELTHG